MQRSAKHSGTSDATKSAAYQAWLGFYNTYTKRLGWSKEECVRRANSSHRSLGLEDPPSIDAQIVRKMGLGGVDAVVVGSEGGRSFGGLATACTKQSRRTAVEERREEDAEKVVGVKGGGGRGRGYF